MGANYYQNQLRVSESIEFQDKERCFDSYTIHFKIIIHKMDLIQNSLIIFINLEELMITKESE